MKKFLLNLVALLVMSAATFSVYAADWIPVGTVTWVKGVGAYCADHTYSNISIERSQIDTTLYRVQPYINAGADSRGFYLSSDVTIYIHILSRDHIYLSPYHYTYRGAYDEYEDISQRCEENDFDVNYYGYVSEDSVTVEFPTSSFFVRNRKGNTSYRGGDFNIVFPLNFFKNIPFSVDDSSASTVDPSPGFELDGEEYGIYLGLKGFNNSLFSKPVGRLSDETKGEYIDFINNLEKDNGTVLYYAIDRAIAELAAPSYPENLKNVVLVTFTDGLDEGSTGYRPEFSRDEYAEYITEKIKQTKIQGVDINAYSIGLMSKYVPSEFMFTDVLQGVASEPSNVITTNDMAGVDKQLQMIVDELIRTSESKIISFSVPDLSDGDVICYTLDHTDSGDSPEPSALKIQGTYSKSKQALVDVVYTGFTSGSGSEVPAVRNSESQAFLDFKFIDCKDLEGAPLIVDVADIDQWRYYDKYSVWVHNIELAKDEDIKIETSYNSTTVIFALDCSSSLEDKFPELKETAIRFVRKLAGEDISLNGIHSVKAGIDENAPVEYYNLEGLKVNPSVPGIYIRRQGTKADKIFIR